MHVHQSLWKNGETLMHAADGYGLLSPLALHYAAGLLEHAPALLASARRRRTPTAGSSRATRLRCYSSIRSATDRRRCESRCTPPRPKTKRVEFRPPDPLANPYLAFPALLMAGLDGIERELDPGEPIDRNLYDLPREQLAGIPTVPTSA